jgi:hypothetical protein
LSLSVPLLSVGFFLLLFCQMLLQAANKRDSAQAVRRIGETRDE